MVDYWIIPWLDTENVSFVPPYNPAIYLYLHLFIIRMIAIYCANSLIYSFIYTQNLIIYNKRIYCEDPAKIIYRALNKINTVLSHCLSRLGVMGNILEIKVYKCTPIKLLSLMRLFITRPVFRSPDIFNIITST